MTLAGWRDLAIILLALEAFVISLVPAFALYFAVRGMLWVIRKLRAVAPPVQGVFRKAASITERASQSVVAPVIATGAALAQARRGQAALTAWLTASLRTRGGV